MGAQENFRKSRKGLRCRACLKRRATHTHHVVYEQKLNEVADSRGFENPSTERRQLVFNVENAFAICFDCHHAHHHASRRIPLYLLSDSNLVFAFRELGAHAYDYLRRRYAGEDERLEVHLRECMKEAA
jgi:hypothetical protein